MNAPVPGAPPSAAPPPSLDTNAPPATFPESRTDPTAPASQPGLTLQPQPAPENPVPPAAPLEIVNGTPINLANPPDQADDLANHLLVVYNQNDFNSQELAQHYASVRQIPPERVLGISCSTEEEITRAEYEKTIREPILDYLTQKNWMTRANTTTPLGNRTIHLLVATRNDIWAMALIRGVPLKIAEDPTDDDTMQIDAPLRTNAASVDTELALLPVFGLPKGGFVPNLFFDIHNTSPRRVGPELAKMVILVTRLDGPKPEQVRRMIDDSIWAEKNRLAGLAVVDARGITDPQNGYYAGDMWLKNARKSLEQDGWTVRYDDNPNVLPATDYSNQVAIYLGWYTDKAVGPWVTPPDRFVRGAVAYHLHSFSANTIRSETENWVGPLIAHGADVTMGTVYEPYLAFTPHEDIFTRHLLAGDYFAEAAYASIPGLSWMVTVVGDPLYRPFRVPLNEALAAITSTHTVHDDWLVLQQLQRDLHSGQTLATAENLQQSLEIPGAGPAAEEQLADLLQKISGSGTNKVIPQAYKKALAEYKLPIDRIRIGLKLAQYYDNQGFNSLARAQTDMLIQQYPEDSILFGVPGAAPPPTMTANAPYPGHGAPPIQMNQDIPQPPPGIPRPPRPPAPTPVPLTP